MTVTINLDDADAIGLQVILQSRRMWWHTHLAFTRQTREDRKRELEHIENIINNPTLKTFVAAKIEAYKAKENRS